MAKAKTKTGAELLASLVRPVTDKDRKNLPKYSHSKVEKFDNCPYSYKLQYVDGLYSSDSTIALESGTLAHLLLELKGKSLIAGEKIDYDLLMKYRENGYDEFTPISNATAADSEKDKININNVKHVPGRIEIMKRYLDDYVTPDSEGRKYSDKWELFDQLLHVEMEDGSGWIPEAFEESFEFVWDNRCVITGFIDRIDKKEIVNEETGEITYAYRVVDYKTSKKKFDDKKVATAQQMCIYACAILLNRGVLPEEYLYRFVFLNDEMTALTKNWEGRFVKAFTSRLDKIEEGMKTKEDNYSGFVPKASPLCHWCNYCITNPNAKEWGTKCEYYSKWTPEEKTFAVNKKWGEVETVENKIKVNLNNINVNNSTPAPTPATTRPTLKYNL